VGEVSPKANLVEFICFRQVVRTLSYLAGSQYLMTRNAFVYGRPSNIVHHAVSMPTNRDADPDTSLDVFIASCRLASILDNLLPILGSEGREVVELEALDRDIILRHGQPGSCELNMFGGRRLMIRFASPRFPWRASTHLPDWAG
jgi:hypothetical protein